MGAVAEWEEGGGARQQTRSFCQSLPHLVQIFLPLPSLWNSLSGQMLALAILAAAITAAV